MLPLVLAGFAAAGAGPASASTAAAAAPKALKPYTGRWYSIESDLELRQFTKTGVAHIEWGGNLPCTSGGCQFKITVKFTTRGQTRTRLNGKVTFVNATAKAGRSFTVGEKVQLFGAPSSRHIAFVSPNSDSAQLCRTIHAKKCMGET